MLAKMCNRCENYYPLDLIAVKTSKVILCEFCAMEEEEEFKAEVKRFFEKKG